MEHQEHAFPVHETPDSTDSPGMTLRDYFAAKAMQELLSQEGYAKFELVAQDAYKMADAMLQARRAEK